LAACAAAVSVSALNKVDLPTLGSPTIPQRKPTLENPVPEMGEAETPAATRSR
jgi:hypothetical protein